MLYALNGFPLFVSFVLKLLYFVFGFIMFKGQLLVAIGKDANENIFPIICYHRS